MVAMRLANSLTPPTGTPDMVVNGSGIASSTTATMVVTSLPAHLEAGYHMIRVTDGSNDEIMRATITPGSTTIGIERQFENAAQLPATSHAAAANVYLIDSKGSWEEYFAEHGQPGGFQYLGNSNIAGTAEGITNNRMVWKKIILANDGWLGSIGAYVQQVNDNSTVEMSVGVATDSGGVPTTLIAVNNGGGDPVGFLTGGPGALGWLDMPIGVWLTAGTYWACVQFFKSAAAFDMYYDASGHDAVATAGGFYVATNAVHAVSDSTKNYSIRAGILTPGGGAGAGSLVLLEQHDASASATLDFTTAITPLYDEYVVELLNVVPATNNVNPYMQFSTDGGATWITSGYGWSSQYVGTDNSPGSAASASDSGIQFFGGLANTGYYSGRFTLYGPNLAKSLRAIFHGGGDSGPPRPYSVVGEGTEPGTTARNAIRIKMSSGNITSGTIRAYGVAKGPVPNPGGFVKLMSVAASGSSPTIDIPNIPQGYSHLQIRFRVKGTNGAGQLITMQINGDTGANYAWMRQFVYSGGFSSGAESNSDTSVNVGAASSSAGTIANAGEINFEGYCETVFSKTFRSALQHWDGAHNFTELASGLWVPATPVAINRVTFTIAAGNFATGTIFDVYGLS